MRSASAVARATSSRDASARTPSSERRASRIRPSCSSNPFRSDCDRSSASRTRCRCSSNVRTPASSRDSDAAMPSWSSVAARTGAPEVLAPRGEPRLELCARVFEPAHFDRERARPLDERGVRRFRLGGPVRLRLHRLAGIEQPALRAVQLVVGVALIGLDPGDRLPRFVLSRVLRALLFLGRASLDGDLLALPAMRSAAPSAVPICRSKPTMAFSCRCCSPCSDVVADSAAAILRSSATELFAHALDRPALRVGALAQLLDLALGREDAARFGAHAALDHVEAAEDVAVERDDRAGHEARRASRAAVEVGRHPGVRRGRPG